VKKHADITNNQMVPPLQLMKKAKQPLRKLRRKLSKMSQIALILSHLSRVTMMVRYFIPLLNINIAKKKSAPIKEVTKKVGGGPSTTSQSSQKKV